jgi:hypothetical protein
MNKKAVVRRADKQERSAPIAALLRDPYILEFARLAEHPNFPSVACPTLMTPKDSLRLVKGFSINIEIRVTGFRND